MNKKALIFGVSGQDGSYLAEFLLEKKCKYAVSFFQEINFLLELKCE